MVDSQTASSSFLIIFTIVIIIMTFSTYLLKAWGLYMISKKLGEEHPWMAWIPYLNIYTMVKA